MDIVDLLILAAFVGLPLLQMIIEKLGGGRKPPPPPPPTEYEPYQIELPPLPRHTQTEDTVDATMEESWSSEWGEWPSDSNDDVEDVATEDVAAEDVMSMQMAEELIALQERLARRRDTPEVARVRVPVVSLEDLEVNRKSEHARLHATAPARIAVIARRAPHPVRGALGTPAELRRAVVLSEVLGKPRSLR